MNGRARNPDPIFTTYYAAADADAAWSAELRRVFGKSSGDARYDARGTSTPELRRLYDAKIAADEAQRADAAARRST